MKACRRITKFQTCKRHEGLLAESRARRAELFCEGGPWPSRPCAGGRCRMWAGTDLFEPSVCEGMREYPLRWRANEEARA